MLGHFQLSIYANFRLYLTQAYIEGPLQLSENILLQFPNKASITEQKLGSNGF